MNNPNPSPSNVRQFFSDEYNFYTKWIAVKDINWDELISDSRILEFNHPFQYCRERIVSTVMLIEAVYMEGKRENE